MENYFEKPIIPQNDRERLKALNYFEVIGGLPDEYYHSLAKTIANTFGAPIGLVSLVAEEDVYFMGNFGMEAVHKVSRGKSLCSLAILDKEPTVFLDALNEPCLLRNPLVHGDFGLRFYAGAPIITNEGFCIGTVCVVDQKPREFSERDLYLLKCFAEVAMKQLYFNFKHKIESLVN